MIPEAIWPRTTPGGAIDVTDQAHTTSVVLVEDHAMIRDMMSRELAAVGFDVVGSAADVDSGYRVWSAHRPDVLLCDVRLDKGTNGIDLVRRVAREDPDAVVVMLSAENDGELVEEAFAAGAAGYVAKRASMPELVETISDARAGVRRSADRYTYRNVADALRKPRQDPGERFTPRERDVLTLMAKGITTTARIAAELHVSPSSVKTYVDGCLRKLEVHTRAEAVAKAYQLGIITH